MIRSLLKGSLSFLAVSNIGVLFSVLILYFNGKILTPEDFGLIGIATILITFLDSFKQIGTKEYLIANGLKDKNEVMGAWTLDLLKAVILFIICISVSPLVSDYYDNLELKWVITLLAFGFLFDGMANPNFYLLRMRLEYRKLVYYNLIFNLFSATTIIALVIYFNDYKGIIWGYFFRSVYQFLFSYIYFPVLPKPTLSKELFSRQFAYGKWIILSGILFFVSSRLDIFIISSQVDLKTLGFYSFAVTVVTGVLQQPLKSINNALFPLLAKNKKEYPILKVTMFTAMLSLIFVTAMLSVGLFLIEYMFDGKWDESIQIIKILSVAAGINAIRVDSFFMVSNKTKVKFLVDFFRAIVVLISMFPLVIYFGVLGAAMSLLLANSFGLIIWSIQVNKLKYDKNTF
jgi:O-antigen/teichoic acid export membrane protein